MLKLLERNVGCGRCGVEIQAMRVLRLLVTRLGELPLAMVRRVLPFGVDAIEFLSLHLGQKLCFSVYVVTGVPIWKRGQKTLLCLRLSR